jgi:hypothetical protein
MDRKEIALSILKSMIEADWNLNIGDTSKMTPEEQVNKWEQVAITRAYRMADRIIEGDQDGE